MCSSISHPTPFHPAQAHSSARIHLRCVVTCDRKHWQDAEVQALMHEVNGVDGVNKVQLILTTSLWQASLPPQPTQASGAPVLLECANA
jgi:hypothetical protein